MGDRKWEMEHLSNIARTSYEHRSKIHGTSIKNHSEIYWRAKMQRTSTRYLWKSFRKSMKICGTFMKICENLWKCLKICENHSKIWKSVEIFGNLWKYMKICKNLWKSWQTKNVSLLKKKVLRNENRTFPNISRKSSDVYRCTWIPIDASDRTPTENLIIPSLLCDSIPTSLFSRTLLGVNRTLRTRCPRSRCLIPWFLPRVASQIVDNPSRRHRP